jgi:hypothetical protein
LNSVEKECFNFDVSHFASSFDWFREDHSMKQSVEFINRNS